MRSKFQEVYEGSVSQRVFDRMLYVLCSQNWEHCGSYFWVKHCIDVSMCALVYIYHGVSRVCVPLNIELVVFKNTLVTAL